MNKKIWSFCMVSVLVIGFSTAVFGAETPTAVFDGSSEIKYNYGDTQNFGSAFLDMMPDEEREQQIILKNTSGEAADFFMEVEVIRALEEASDASGAAYEFALRVTSHGKTETIYGGAPGENAWIGGNDQGLADVNDTLEGYGENGIKAASLASGEQAVLSLTVRLDGITAGNAYQQAAGTFQFRFHAGYDQPETVTRQVKQPDRYVKRTEYLSGSKTKTVKTGDEADAWKYLLMGGMSFASGIYFLKKRRKETGEIKTRKGGE